MFTNARKLGAERTRALIFKFLLAINPFPQDKLLHRQHKAMRLETNAPPLHAPTTKTWETCFKNPRHLEGKSIFPEEVYIMLIFCYNR